MFEMELYQLFSFGRQLGLALVGAGSLWGIVFLYLAHRKAKDDPAGVLLDWIGLRLRWLVFLGGVLAFSMWTLLTLFIPLEAHEGVTLITTKMEVLKAMDFMAPLYLILIFIILLAFVLRKPKFLYSEKYGISWFYLITFILSLICISYYTNLSGIPLRESTFHIFHGFHSIFTLGTVLTLDFMFLSSRNAPFVQKHLFPLFPKISKVIWVGLSLDLLSTLLIFPDAIALSPRFFFAQSVVGILIINGILLSGILTRRILENLEKEKKETSAKWERFATVSGAISVTSWTSIIFVDFFHSMTLSLGQLFSVYFIVIAIIIVGHSVWSRLDTRGEKFGE